MIACPASDGDVNGPDTRERALGDDCFPQGLVLCSTLLRGRAEPASRFHSQTLILLAGAASLLLLLKDNSNDLVGFMAL